MRIREHLGIGEIDAVWIYTATNSMYRFHEGHWQCSRNVYYGADDGWFNWSSEPSAWSDDRFVEMSPGQDTTDPAFADMISKLVTE